MSYRFPPVVAQDQDIQHSALSVSGNSARSDLTFGIWLRLSIQSPYGTPDCHWKPSIWTVMKCHLHRICAPIWDLRAECPASILSGAAQKNEPVAPSDAEEAWAVVHGTEIATGFPDASCSDVGRWKPARDYANVLLEFIAGDTGAIGPAIVQVPLFSEPGCGRQYARTSILARTAPPRIQPLQSRLS